MDIDELFALPPEDFTAARDTLARSLKAEGRREEAASVGALRRPTVAAWAVNRVAQREPGAVMAVREAGAALVREQRRALSGVGRADLRGVTTARREAVDAALTVAEAHLAEAGIDPSAHRDRIRATLEAASADDAAGEVVTVGRLTRELAAPSGLGALDGLRVVPGSATRRASDRAAAARDRAADARAEEERARMRATAAQEAVARLEAELAGARERAVDAAHALDAATRSVAEAGAAAAAAEQEAGSQPPTSAG